MRCRHCGAELRRAYAGRGDYTEVDSAGLDVCGSAGVDDRGRPVTRYHDPEEG